MIKVGEYNKLKAVRQTDNGVYFASNNPEEEVLLPNKYIPDELYEDDELELFVFKDHEGRLTATTQKPKVTVNKFGYLWCKDVNDYGAFLKWGLDKDLLVPFREQAERMKEDQRYLVYVYVDKVSGRLVGTSRYLRYLRHKTIELEDGQEVELIIDNSTDMGVNVIINDTYQGLIHASDFHTQLKRGDRCKGYIKHVRKDGKIDVSLHASAFDRVSASAQKVLGLLKESEDGSLPYHDKTPAEVIKKELSMSKKTFKQAIGGLYSRKLILIKDDGIYLDGPRKPKSKDEEDE